LRQCVINFCFPEYLAILERLGVERDGSLGYYGGFLRLIDRTWDKERRFRMFNRLSHEALTKTNYQKICPNGNKTRDLEPVMSLRQDAGLTSLDLLTWHG
jgi:hypothetical protein